jgi:glycosyltransferase involved in cell wall biosynthesis
MASELTSLAGKRVALVTNIPRPYREPLYAALHRGLQDRGATFSVFYYSDQSRHVCRRGTEVAAGEYLSVAASGLEISLGYERVLSLPTHLAPALMRYRPDVIICGAFGPTGLLAWLYTRLFRVPYVQWSGATPGGPGGRLTRAAQCFLARRAQACLSYGSVARESLIGMGARAERVVQGVNAVDAAFFIAGRDSARAEAEGLKRERRLEGVNVLYVGSLVSRKGLSYVLDALTQVGNQAHLHVVGGGPCEDALRSQAEASDLAGRVHFWGARHPEELPLYYALADLFVFPSLYDVWGLVLNEAMACGLPVVASPLAGATRDLVEEGTNGFVVDPRDVPALAAALARLIADAQLRARMGAAGAATVQGKATIRDSADAFLRAIELAFEPAR